MTHEPHEPSPGLRSIDLPQDRPGFHHFISAWQFEDASGRRVLVDPGPASTIPLLLRELEALGGPDLILLTHIHLDHSGGLAQLCEASPHAQVLAHPRAFAHLQDPHKLWSASVATLGDVALLYGEPAPLPPSAELLTEDPEGLIEVFQTPGHAPHHLCFRATCGGRSLLFVGEAAGMVLPIEGGPGWLRPTTPPRFDAGAALRSMDALLSALRGDELLCYAHWGASASARERIEAARAQLVEWRAVVRDMRDAGPDAILDELLRRDPFPASLSPDLVEREMAFMRNSVLGLAASLDASTPKGA